MAKYKSEFYSLNNTKYEVNLVPVSNTDANWTEIMLSGEEPVVISVSADDLFTPIKSRSCTIKMVTNTFLTDLYTSELKGVNAKIYRYNGANKILIFNGYVTPNIYTSSLDVYNEVEIECVEPISLLKDIDFTCSKGQQAGIEIGLNDSTPKIINLYSLLKNLLYVKCGYQYMNVHQDLKLSSSEVNTNIINNLYINEFNFYPTEGEWQEKFQPSVGYGELIYVVDTIKCEEVLEEVLNYLNMSLVIIDNIPTLINYNNLSIGNFNFTQFHFTDNTSQNIVIGSLKTVNANSFKQGTPSLSLSETYNKLGCSANFKEVKDDELCPDLFSLALQEAVYNSTTEQWQATNNINSLYLKPSSAFTNYEYIYWKRYRSPKWKTYNYFGTNYDSTGTTTNLTFFLKDGTWSDYIPKYKYNISLSYLTNPRDVFNYITMNDETGLTRDYFLGYKHADLNKYSGYVTTIEELYYNYNYVAEQTYGATILKFFEFRYTGKLPEKADFKDYVVFELGVPNYTKYEGTDYYNFVNKLNSSSNMANRDTGILCEYESDTDICVGNDETEEYLVINANVRYGDFNLPFEYPDVENSDLPYVLQKKEKITGTDDTWWWPTLNMRLFIGDKFYSTYISKESSGKWVEGNYVYTYQKYFDSTSPRYWRLWETDSQLTIFYGPVTATINGTTVYFNIDFDNTHTIQIYAEGLSNPYIYNTEQYIIVLSAVDNVVYYRINADDKIIFVQYYNNLPERYKAHTIRVINKQWSNSLYTDSSQSTLEETKNYTFFYEKITSGTPPVEQIVLTEYGRCLRNERNQNELLTFVIDGHICILKNFVESVDDDLYDATQLKLCVYNGDINTRDTTYSTIEHIYYQDPNNFTVIDDNATYNFIWFRWTSRWGCVTYINNKISTGFYLKSKSSDNKLLWNGWMETYNEVEYPDAIEEKGQKIIIPKGQKMNGKLKVQFLLPFINADMFEYESKDGIQRIRQPRFMAMKDFSIKYCKPNHKWSEDEYEEGDLKYVTLINSDFTKEGEEVDLKLNTYDSKKKPTYSAMLKGNYTENVTQYGTDKFLNVEPVQTLYSYALDLTNKPEYLFLEERYNHYREPRKMITMNVQDNNYTMADKVDYTNFAYNLIINSFSQDLQNDSTELNLIEF